MKLRQYQIDAFTDRVFAGNPAAVCPLDAWLDDPTLQAIAAENNLSETAFFVPEGDGFHLRWFTPSAEVDLCGHATLAAAHVLFELLGHAEQTITFRTRSGALTVEQRDGMLAMDFPALEPVPRDTPAALVAGLRMEPCAVLAGRNLIAVFGSESTIRELRPDPAPLCELDLRGVVVTAPGDEVDFVSRFFAPKIGLAEDPVTGSTHCELMPYWATRLGRNTLHARQVSPRSGDIRCELNGDRVTLLGRAVTFMEGEIRI